MSRSTNIWTVLSFSLTLLVDFSPRCQAFGERPEIVSDHHHYFVHAEIAVAASDWCEPEHLPR